MMGFYLSLFRSRSLCLSVSVCGFVRLLGKQMNERRTTAIMLISPRGLGGHYGLGCLGLEAQNASK